MEDEKDALIQSYDITLKIKQKASQHTYFCALWPRVLPESSRLPLLYVMTMWSVFKKKTLDLRAPETMIMGINYSCN